jgi:hypothetical protein
MADNKENPDREFLALRTINKLLGKLSKAEVERVLTYIAEKYGFDIIDAKRGEGS